jgi:hypothetical protein
MSIITDLLLTRLAVLGLSNVTSWPDRVEMLAFVLPRTAPIASIKLGTAIACQQHDQAVGPGHYHLFRLTMPLEERISKELQHFQTKALPNSTLEECLSYLAQVTEGMAIDSKPGPVAMGLYNELTQHPADTITCMAKHYLLAHQKGYQAFPYFS